MAKDDNLIKIGSTTGDDIFFQILKDNPRIDGDDLRQDSILFSLFTNCIVQLHAAGWSEQNLINEVFRYCEISRDIVNDLDDDE